MPIVYHNRDAVKIYDEYSRVWGNTLRDIELDVNERFHGQERMYVWDDEVWPNDRVRRFLNAEREVLDIHVLNRNVNGVPLKHFSKIKRSEWADRIEKFRARTIEASNILNMIRDQFLVYRQDAIVEAWRESKSEYGGTELRNPPLHKIVLNWIPFMRQYHQDHPEVYQNYPNLKPQYIFHFLTEKKFPTRTILLDMLQMIEDYDMNEFVFTDNDTFLHNFVAKFTKLRALADGIRIMNFIKENNDNIPITKRSLYGENEDSVKRTLAKCRMANELLAEYENRIRMLISPYNAVFIDKDFKKFTAEEINAKRRDLPYARSGLPYLDNVANLKYMKETNTSYEGANIQEREAAYINEIVDVPRRDLRPNSVRIFQQLEDLLRVMSNDRSRASRYNNVKTAIQTYFGEDNPERKKERIEEVVAAAGTYLETRRASSYAYRKERCEQVMTLYTDYLQELANVNGDQLLEEYQEAKFKIESKAKLVTREQELKDIRKKQKEDAQKKKKEALEKAVNNIDEENKEEKAKIKDEIKLSPEEEKVYNELFENLNSIIINFYALGQKGKTAEDAANVRKDVIDFLNIYIFAENKELDKDYNNAHLEVVPTKMIIDCLKAMENYVLLDKSVYKKDDFIKHIKESISKKLRDNSETNKEAKKHISGYLEKYSNDVTELDKLNAYEYSLYIIGSMSDSEISYDALKSMDFDKLGTLASHLIAFNESGVDKSKNKSLFDLSNETRNKHNAEAVKILSILSEKKQSIFKHLTLNGRDRYVQLLIKNITNTKKFNELLSECEKEARANKDRYDTFTDAIKTGDKEKLCKIISKYSEIDVEKLDEIPKFELMKVVKDMLDSYKNEGFIKKSTDGIKKILDGGVDYYKEKYLDLETKRKAGKVADKPEERRELCYAYVKKAFNWSKGTLGALNNLSDDGLYKLFLQLEEARSQAKGNLKESAKGKGNAKGSAKGKGDADEPVKDNSDEPVKDNAKENAKGGKNGNAFKK